MNKRGRRPTPGYIRLIEGTYRADRHGSPATGRESARMDPLPRPEKPKGMRGKAAKAWRRWIEPAVWLDVTREPAAVAFCELWAEFRAAPSRFLPSRHAQMRAYMSEIGLTDRRRRAFPDYPDGDEFFG